MPEIELNSGEVYYELSGDESLPVLIFSNSLGTNLSMWSAQMPGFQNKFRILRYDTRGHGKSSIPQGPYTIEQMGRDVLDLLDALGFARVHFCGLSMGGMIGQWLGAHAADRIDRLVLANTGALIGTPEGWNERIALVRSHGMGAIVQPVLERWFTADYRQNHPDVLADTAAMLLATNPEGYCASCAAVRDMDQRLTASRIAVPTMIVAGLADSVVPSEAAAFLATEIRGSRVLTLNAAHLSNIEASQGFTNGVLAFLAQEAFRERQDSL
jgi:3-oxoadipate enol-lactonase